MRRLKSIVFNLSDQKDFSKFSGDYNPMHVDPISARRFLFSEPVVHGINVVLNALESWSSFNKCRFNLSNINGEFNHPVLLNKEVFIDFKKNKNTHHLQIISQNKVCSSIYFKLNNSDIQETVLILDKFPKKIKPKKNNLESIRGSEGEVSLDLKIEYLRLSFPSLHKYSSFNQIACLLSSTRIVGMYCPGMNSIYSSFNFSFNEKSSKTTFKLDKINRFGFASVAVNGLYNGKIDAILRPDHVNQLKYIDVKKLVGKNEFKNQSALIIGGSRGIGEVTAKILAAGGAEVLITYNKGKEDAKNICNQINSNEGKISMMCYDINNPTIIENFEPTDIYYFATPNIFEGNNGNFSSDLYNQFSKFYLSSFFNLVNYWKEKKVLNFFYPSTIAIDEMPNDMLEYSLTKHSAERMCEFLENNNNIKIFKPRLPRLATDQTVSFLPIKNYDTLEYMLKTLKEYNLIRKK